MLIKYELDTKGTGHVFFRNKLLHAEQSQFQSIEISDLDILGRVLVLDNIISIYSKLVHSSTRTSTYLYEYILVQATVLLARTG